MEVRVRYPAAWLHVPLNQTPMVRDPDVDDDPPRNPRALRGGWRRVGESVNLAVEKAKEVAADIWIPSVVVTIPDLPSKVHRSIVWEWTGSDGPCFAPSIDLVRNGRHRTWGALKAGLASVPVLDDHVEWALAAWHASEGDMTIPDLQSLDELSQDRDWWRCSAAEPWLALNQEFPAVLDEVIHGWRRRLSN